MVAGCAGVLAILTSVVPDWIEVTGWDPDHHGGYLEGLVVGLLGLSCVASGSLACWQWRHQAVLAQ
jgi:hypothetical protein